MAIRIPRSPLPLCERGALERRRHALYSVTRDNSPLKNGAPI